MRVFNSGTETNPSSHGEQILDAYFERKAIEEVAKEQYFTQLANAVMMPKNTGKMIERYVHIPILDDRNINDQGIDATGRKIAEGNLYGSSRDVGTITRKMPVIQERGGRVNRVGFTRQKITGTMQNFGYFTEYTQDSLDFDTEDDLDMYVNREMLAASSRITEDLLQIDLLNAAGIIVYAGTATSTDTIKPADKVVYEDLARLAVTMDNTRTPKSTKIIVGSTKIDTRTLPASRVMFIGPDLVQDIRRMTDYHGERAFIPVEQYGDQSTLLRGEIGAVDQFRIVVNPEMMSWQGAGADAGSGASVHATNGKVDVFPMLVVGDDSFTTIGFQPSGTNTKFTIIHRKPGPDQASNSDPYGKRGFMSIQWWYGFMVYRPERVALIKTAVAL